MGRISGRDVIWVKLYHKEKIYICYITKTWNPFGESDTPFIILKGNRYLVLSDGKLTSTKPLFNGHVEGRWMYSRPTQRVLMNLKGEADL